MGQNSLVSIDLSMLIQIINFFILVYVFWKLFSKKIGGVIEERKKVALKDLEEVKSERQKLEFEKESLSKLSKESKRRANDIIIKAERQADERKDQIVTAANQTREKMILKADAEVVKMKEKAKKELQKEVSDIAIQIAEKLIKQNISEDATLQDKSIDNFINELGE